MSLDHEAIYKAYAGTVVTIDDSKGAFDASGNSISLEQSKIDAARATLDAEAAATLYKRQRTGEAFTTDTIYAPIGDQLDMLFIAIDADSDLKTKFATWHTHISAVKAKYPKP